MSAKQARGLAAPNYTQVPNQIFALMPSISNAELRITLALIRLTLGWHRQRTERLSIPELAEAAGISPNSAKTGLQEAMRRGTVRRHKARDELNRVTYRYSLVIDDEISAEAFERPKREKPGVSDVQDDTNTQSSSQNLAGSKFGRVKRLSSQNLAGWSVKSSSQNLAGSYKEERNYLVVKEKHTAGADAPVVVNEENQDTAPTELDLWMGFAQTPNGAASDEAESQQASPVQVKMDVQAIEKSKQVTGSEQVAAAGGGEAGPDAQEPVSHWEMFGSVRTALYPGVPLIAPSIESQIAKAAKELRLIGLPATAPADILAYIKLKQDWRKTIEPMTLVNVSAAWQSWEASRMGAQKVVKPPAVEGPGCRPGERRRAPDGQVWTVESVNHGAVNFEEYDAPPYVPVGVVATWPVEA
jgi:hypothetical protein